MKRKTKPCKWRAYEQAKQELRSKNLPPQEYERELAKITERLGV